MTDDHVTINGRRYPSLFPPGSHWATDRAWQILDELPDGALSDQRRALLAGLITVKLMEVRTADNNRLRKAIHFFASVIKSGEPWTETCQKEFDEALR